MRAKAGKTSLFNKLVKKKYGNSNKGLLVAFEKGYQALAGVYAQDVNTWTDFIEIVDQFVKGHSQLPFKMVAIDTVDIAYRLASEYVVTREKIKDKKQYKELSDIPWGAGYQMAGDEFAKQIERLVKVGIGVWFITHDKDKKFKSREGQEYDQTTVSLPTKAREVVINMSDFIIFIDNAKVDVDGKIVDQRFIHFRAEGSDLEAGSRFSNITPKIPYDVDLFIEAFEEAVLSEVGDVDVTALKERQQAEREARASEYVEAEAEAISAERLIHELDVKLKNPLEDETKQKVIAKFKSLLGTANYRTSDDVAALQEALEYVKSLG